MTPGYFTAIPFEEKAILSSEAFLLLSLPVFFSQEIPSFVGLSNELLEK